MHFLMSKFLLLADEAAATTAETGNSVGVMGYVTTFLPLILIVVLMYFMLIRPQKKKQKEEKQMRDNLRVGDELTTIGGVYGRVVGITDRTVVIETSEDRVRVEFVKSAIGSVGTLEEQAAAAAAPRRGKKAAAEAKNEAPAVEEAPAAEETAPAEENKTEE